MIYATNGVNVLSTSDADVTNLSPCSHKEKGCRKLWMRTVDMDVLILAIAMFSRHINPDELWIAFGSKLYFRYIPVHEIVRGLESINGPINVQNIASFPCINWL